MENTEIERGLYDVMHGSSEMLLPSNKWLVVIPGKIKPDWSGRGAYSFTMVHLLIVYLILQLHSIKLVMD